MNVVILIGNVTRDPETKVIGDNKTVSKFGLAVNRKFGKTEETTFVDVECWGATAETVSAYLTKGRQVAVQGRLKQDNWEDKQSGEKRSKLFVVADRVQFLGSKTGDKTEAAPADQPEADVPF